MAASNNPDMTIIQGSTYRREVLWESSDGTPIDLTGRTARLVVREPASEEDPILVLTSDPANGITLGGVDGTIDIVIGADVTATLPVGVFRFDLRVVLDVEEATVLLRGKATVRYSQQEVYS